MDASVLDSIVQQCRAQINLARENHMSTSNLRGTLESLKKLKSFVDDESLKLDAAIADAVTEVPVAFKAAHDTVSGMRGTVNEISEYLDELKKSNGGGPLDSSTKESPRSSEVAQK